MMRESNAGYLSSTFFLHTKEKKTSRFVVLLSLSTLTAHCRGANILAVYHNTLTTARNTRSSLNIPPRSCAPSTGTADT